MSSESSELSPKMFIEDPESRAKPYQKGYFILKRELIATIAIIFLILGIPLVALSVHSIKERKVLNEKIDEERHLLNGKINDQNEKIEVNANNIKVLESFKTFYGFERIGKYGYFQKLEEKMTYEDGQKACSKIFGHIIEFDMTSNDYSGKISAIISKLNLNSFFLGLTDYQEEGVWTWESTGESLNCTKPSWTWQSSNCQPYPWGENEPNGKKKEDCAVIEVVHRKWYMNDIACSTKTNVVCEKSFDYNELDVDDLPKH